MSQSPFGRLPHKDLLSVAQLSAEDIDTVFATARALKEGRDHYTDLLARKRLAMIFEKDSLRTRFTFDIGMQELGGRCVFLDHRDARIGSREALRDVARNLERWVDVVVLRTFKHKAVEEVAAHCSIPVINGLTDFLHPCQALTDFFTLSEKWGDARGRKLVYVGDGNNTCHSLIYTAAALGVHMTVCTPEGYEPNAKVVNEAMHTARTSGAELVLEHEPKAAVHNADAIYTDVWASMGQEGEIEERNAAFEHHQVNEELMACAKGEALFMHCLPAHRGAEVTAAVLDSPRSAVFDTAENRLHVQKAILVLLLGSGEARS